MIPARLVRSVPTVTTDEVEGWWQKAIDLHPGWDHITYRDPVSRSQFPLTSPHWDRCHHGAQRAGLIRLEALYNRGGFWLDSDIELYRSLEPLRPLSGVAGWEDANTVPDAFMGFEANHPALLPMIHEAIERIPDGPWESGPGVLTRQLPGRTDVLLLPPGSMYPYHYSVKRRYDPTRPDGRRRREELPRLNPFAFGAHHWHASWTGR